jgi:hypothetical protein
MAVITDDLIEYNIDIDDYNNFIETYVTPAEPVNVSLNIIIFLDRIALYN